MHAPVPPRSLLRARGGPAGSRVTFIELFFDLVFVFAITQLSHTLLADMSAAGVARTAVLFVSVWWVWIDTSWVTNWLDPARAPVRVMLFLLMLAGIVMATALPQAFGPLGWPFALAHVLAQAGRSAFMITALRRESPANMRNFQRILAWKCLAGLFWLTGAAAPPAMRLALWALAIGLESAAPAVAFHVPGMGRSRTTDWDVSGAHMAERCGLFVIIALGETLILTCVTFEKAGWSTLTFAALLVSFATTVAMWWIYFDTGIERAEHAITGAQEPGRLARLGYTYLHLPIVAGIVLAAVGDELVLAHPTGHSDAATQAIVVGGPALFLAGALLFKWAAAGRAPLSHWIGLALLTVCAMAGHAVSPLLLAVLVSAALAVTAAWETASLRGIWADRGPRKEH
jgi:low temperature requirement protein LtrA